jgi:predicted cobalt transporter CbtA
MTARALLVRGLVAGLLAGLATFLVASQVGQPHLETAISLEGSGGHHSHDSTPGVHAHSHDSGADHSADEVVVSRGTQRTWGLLTATLTVGVALGGLVALGSALAAGRVGRLRATAASAVVALAGFVAVALVPFLKYPANPPGVGSAETIGARTEYYFGFLLISVVTGVVATAVAARAWPRIGSWGATVLGAGTYVVVVAVAAALMPSVDEVGAFPADTLWAFRRGSLLTLVTLWATLGIVLSGLVSRLERRDAAITRRRALAASL